MPNDEVKLLPCPLCNVELFHNGGTELGDIYEHPANGCAIQVAWFTATPEWVAKWNRRAIPSTGREETGWRDIASAPGNTRVPVAWPTYSDLRAAIEQSRSRNVAGGGWSLTDKQADTALEWVDLLEGIGAPCPKIAGFDEGLQLVWPGSNGRHYLSLDDATDGAFVLNVDHTGRRAAAAVGEK